MRTIKFRGKRVDNGQWVYSMTMGYGTIKRKSKRLFFEIGIDNWCEVIPETVGQFTGLTDNNGVDIYEHDKVKVDSSGVGGAFHDGIYTVQYSLIDCAFYLDGTSGIGFNECYIYEVVGNIHETQTA